MHDYGSANPCFLRCLLRYLRYLLFKFLCIRVSSVFDPWLNLYFIRAGTAPLNEMNLSATLAQTLRPFPSAPLRLCVSISSLRLADAVHVLSIAYFVTSVTSCPNPLYPR